MPCSQLACDEDGMTSEDLGTMLEEDVAIEAAHDEAERESDWLGIQPHAD